MNTAPHLMLTREQVGEPACWSIYESYPLRGQSIRNPGLTVIFGERNAGWDPPQAIIYTASYGFRMYRWLIEYGDPVDWTRHGRSCNWAFYDGRAAPMTELQFWETGVPTGHGWVE
jgi:prepilin-type processing-associated H-X9-DG protein